MLQFLYCFVWKRYWAHLFIFSMISIPPFGRTQQLFLLGKSFEVITLQSHHSPCSHKNHLVQELGRTRLGPKPAFGSVSFVWGSQLMIFQTQKTTLCLCLWRKYLDSLSESCWIYSNDQHGTSLFMAIFGGGFTCWVQITVNDSMLWWPGPK